MLIAYLVAMLVVFVCKPLSAQIAWVFSSEIMINMKLFSNLSKRAQKRIQEILIEGKVQTLSKKRPQKRFWANYFSPKFHHYPQQANLLKNNRRSCRYKNFQVFREGGIRTHPFPTLSLDPPRMLAKLYSSWWSLLLYFREEVFDFMDIRSPMF